MRRPEHSLTVHAHRSGNPLADRPDLGMSARIAVRSWAVNATPRLMPLMVSLSRGSVEDVR